MTDSLESKLKEIAERADEATAGPWYHNDAMGVWRGSKNNPHKKMNASLFLATTYKEEDYGFPQPIETVQVNNANFIAHARTDVPYLISLNKELKAKADKLAEAAQAIDKAFGDNFICGYCESKAGDGHVSQCELKQALKEYRCEE